MLQINIDSCPKKINIIKALYVALVLCAVCAPQAYAAEEYPSVLRKPEKGFIQRVLKIPPQEWQLRRAKYHEIVKGVAAHDLRAVKAFDEVLTEFETHPNARTPMENMEILGTFYVPKEGIDKPLIIIAENAVLGWYDALRFGSESGRAEILHNERFFALPFLIVGRENGEKAKQFLENNPDLAAKNVELGLQFAEKAKDSPDYDHHWPTAYGLERIICAEGGACEPPYELPKNQWDAAWEKAKQQVAMYYKANPGKEVTPRQ